MCAGSIVLNSIYRANQPKGAVIAMVGVGGLGYPGIQYTKALRYKIVVVSARPLVLEQWDRSRSGKISEAFGGAKWVYNRRSSGVHFLHAYPGETRHTCSGRLAEQTHSVPLWKSVAELVRDYRSPGIKGKLVVEID
ncbi:hypothetical protein BDV93DRAFT_199349 [Ceratobasidium sp. AG-I]|nr:hypothetical protein BDV93DRAFT_199349 [Ceratobasidium sp. AG-I]